MLSRVAENIYWMARHLERAENTARLVCVHSETRLDRPEEDGFYWEPVLSITGMLDDFDAQGLSHHEREATNFLLSDARNPASLVSTCARARENIRILLETLPRESWEAVNGLHEVASRPGVAAPQRRDGYLRDVIARTQGMTGLFLGAMSDDAGFAFLRLGRAVERGDFVTRVLLSSVSTIADSKSPDPTLHTAEWVGVLKSLTAYQMYRRSVRGAVTRKGALRFLALSTVFPRSLAYCIWEAEQALARLPGSAPMAATVGRLFATLAAEGEAAADEQRLMDLLTTSQSEIASLHDAITRTYFAPPAEAAQPVQTQSQSA